MGGSTTLQVQKTPWMGEASASVNIFSLQRLTFPRSFIVSCVEMIQNKNLPLRKLAQEVTFLSYNLQVPVSILLTGRRISSGFSWLYSALNMTDQ
jgi:hypothetical protein